MKPGHTFQDRRPCDAFARHISRYPGIIPEIKRWASSASHPSPALAGGGALINPPRLKSIHRLNLYWGCRIWQILCSDRASPHPSLGREHHLVCACDRFPGLGRRRSTQAIPHCSGLVSRYLSAYPQEFLYAHHWRLSARRKMPIPRSLFSAGRLGRTVNVGLIRPAALNRSLLECRVLGQID